MSNIILWPWPAIQHGSQLQASQAWPDGQEKNRFPQRFMATLARRQGGCEPISGRRQWPFSGHFRLSGLSWCGISECANPGAPSCAWPHSRFLAFLASSVPPKRRGLQGFDVVLEVLVIQEEGYRADETVWEIFGQADRTFVSGDWKAVGDFDLAELRPNWPWHACGASGNLRASCQRQREKRRKEYFQSSSHGHPPS